MTMSYFVVLLWRWAAQIPQEHSVHYYFQSNILVILKLADQFKQMIKLKEDIS